MHSLQEYKQILEDWKATLPPEDQRRLERARQGRRVRTPRAERAECSQETQDAFATPTGARINYRASARAAIALERISVGRCNQYDTWVAVGMALSELGRIGYVLWDEWSKGSAKYDPTACAEKWPTFTPGDGLTLASLDVWANEDDPRPDQHADGCTPDCPNRARIASHAVTIRQLEEECTQLRDRNRFVTNAQGAKHIKSASLRDTVVELKKELDAVPVEERRPDAFVPVRPAYMGARVNLSASTVNRHLQRLEKQGIIERRVETTYDAENETYSAKTYVRPVVDLADPSKLVVPSAHGGHHPIRCVVPACGSTNIVDKIQRICLDCNTPQAPERQVPVNRDEVEDLTDRAAYEAAIVAAHDPIQTAFELANASCVAINNDPLSTTPSVDPMEEIQETQDAFATLPSPTPAHVSPLLDVSDPAKLPGVRSGMLAADDPWIRHQQEMAKARRL